MKERILSSELIKAVVDRVGSVKEATTSDSRDQRYRELVALVMNCAAGGNDLRNRSPGVA